MATRPMRQAQGVGQGGGRLEAGTCSPAHPSTSKQNSSQRHRHCECRGLGVVGDTWDGRRLRRCLLHSLHNFNVHGATVHCTRRLPKRTTSPARLLKGPRKLVLAATIPTQSGAAAPCCSNTRASSGGRGWEGDGNGWAGAASGMCVPAMPARPAWASSPPADAVLPIHPSARPAAAACSRTRARASSRRASSRRVTFERVDGDGDGAAAP